MSPPAPEEPRKAPTSVISQGATRCSVSSQRQGAGPGTGLVKHAAALPTFSPRATAREGSAVLLGGTPAPLVMRGRRRSRSAAGAGRGDARPRPHRASDVDRRAASASPCLGIGVPHVAFAAEDLGADPEPAVFVPLVLVEGVGDVAGHLRLGLLVGFGGGQVARPLAKPDRRDRPAALAVSPGPVPVRTVCALIS